MIGTTGLMAVCEAAGIRLSVTTAGDLAIDAPREALTADLLRRLKAHKAELLALFQGNGSAVAADDDEIEPPDACRTCGSLELWESIAGNWHCQHCEPATKAKRLRRAAARSRSGASRQRA